MALLGRLSNVSSGEKISEGAGRCICGIRYAPVVGTANLKMLRKQFASDLSALPAIEDGNLGIGGDADKPWFSLPKATEAACIFLKREGGTVKTGRHIRYPANTPLNNLWLSMMERVDVRVPFLGDSTGTLKGLAG